MCFCLFLKAAIFLVFCNQMPPPPPIIIPILVGTLVSYEIFCSSNDVYSVKTCVTFIFIGSLL